MPAAVMTKVSPTSVPMTTTRSLPSPPSMLTGALVAYWMKSRPWPALTAVTADSATKVRTTKVSSPASPLRVSVARLRKTSKTSSPLPPLSTAGNEMPLESSPRVELKNWAAGMPNSASAV